MGVHNLLNKLARADDAASSGTDLDLANLDIKAKTLVTGTGTIGTQGAALTAAKTTITITDAEGTPDYALSALTTTSPYGLATLAEMVSLLYVIQNLQVRMAEVEARLEAAGLVTAN